MTLKHLAGSLASDLTSTHGVSRLELSNKIEKVMQAICVEFPISEDELQRIANEFRRKSTGGLFENVVGVFDGCMAVSYTHLTLPTILRV